MSDFDDDEDEEDADEDDGFGPTGGFGGQFGRGMGMDPSEDYDEEDTNNVVRARRFYSSQNL
jgi:hypothetical protein